MGIKYKAGYKYQVVEDYTCNIELYTTKVIKSEFAELSPPGVLLIKKGYAFDGPSGIAIDTKKAMRGALIHDVLYQMMREGLIPQTARKQADLELRKACIEDGMIGIRVWWIYRAVRRFAGFAANPKNDKVILTAP